MSDKFEKFKKNAAERESKAEASDGSTLEDEVKSRGNRNDNDGKIEEAKAKIKAAKEKAAGNSDGAVKARGVKKTEVGPKKRKKKTKKASKAFEGAHHAMDVHRTIHQDILDMTDDHHAERIAHEKKKKK